MYETKHLPRTPKTKAADERQAVTIQAFQNALDLTDSDNKLLNFQNDGLLMQLANMYFRYYYNS